MYTLTSRKHTELLLSLTWASQITSNYSWSQHTSRSEGLYSQVEGLSKPGLTLPYPSSRTASTKDIVLYPVINVLYMTLKPQRLTWLHTHIIQRGERVVCVCVCLCVCSRTASNKDMDVCNMLQNRALCLLLYFHLACMLHTLHYSRGVQLNVDSELTHYITFSLYFVLVNAHDNTLDLELIMVCFCLLIH